MRQWKHDFLKENKKGREREQKPMDESMDLHELESKDGVDSCCVCLPVQAPCCYLLERDLCLERLMLTGTLSVELLVSQIHLLCTGYRTVMLACGHDALKGRARGGRGGHHPGCVTGRGYS